MIHIEIPGEGSRVQQRPLGFAKANVDIFCTRRYTPMIAADFKQGTCRKARASSQYLQVSDCGSPIA
ncbi:hypothetical protein FBZ94_1142 [Bradyrhizobium sacchari]|uniref:Uncharacterized protein n=1 Tax=Bradyrhizobium sacchari TaxID=1399419 RepID=A0A560J9K6_9BRAD|nr:hypothetical protein FBZ94_1142 [Bradyrhizobium sacchari]TWB67881.1 hypothetical protein FBZ95_1132 [Bradyrhizobium sacchari]